MPAKASVKTVLMTHLVPAVDPNDDYQRYVDGAKRYFSGPITLAKGPNAVDCDETAIGVRETVRFENPEIGGCAPIRRLQHQGKCVATS
jgi:hypothetical protein